MRPSTSPSRRARAVAEMIFSIITYYTQLRKASRGRLRAQLSCRSPTFRVVFGSTRVTATVLPYGLFPVTDVAIIRPPGLIRARPKTRFPAIDDLDRRDPLGLLHAVHVRN